MKKICFIVSSPLTASSFLNGPINKLSRIYEVYLIVNLNNEHNNLIDKLNVKKVFHFEIIRNIKSKIYPPWRIDTLFSKKRYRTLKNTKNTILQ